MENPSLQDIFDELIRLGFAKKETPVRKKAGLPVVKWEDTFDLSGWRGWTTSMNIIKTELIERGQSQEVIVKGVATQDNEVGYSTLGYIKITFVRKMPVEKRNTITDPMEILSESCSWTPTAICYYMSAGEMGDLVHIDPIKKG